MTERISIITDEISQDLADVRAFLHEHAIHAVELRCIAGRRVPEICARDRKTLRAWARDADPMVLAVSPGLFKCDIGDRREIRHQLTETLPRSIDLAYDLDARFLVTFAFHNPGGRPLDDGALDPLREAACASEAAGLPLLVENEPGFLAGSAHQTLKLLDTAAHPNLRANWDPLNGNEYDEPRLAEGLRDLFPFVQHVHVKNGHLREGTLLAECCALRDGAIDWPAHLALLGELGYDGHLGVETHYEPVRENSVVVVGQLREMLAEAGFEGTAS